MENDDGTRALVRRAQSGDNAAREELFQGARAELSRTLRRAPRGVARVDRSDLVQEALADAALGLQRFDVERVESFGAWLASIVTNRCRMALRRERSARRDAQLEVLSPPSQLARSGAKAASWASPSRAVLAQERHDRLNVALCALPADQASAVRWIKLEGRSLADVAAGLGRSENAVKKLLGRALLGLRKELSDGVGESAA